MINETTIKIAIAIIVTVLIVGLIKKVIKFAIIAVCVLVVGLFSYDFIVLGNNPIESINNIKNDVVYIKDASQSVIDIKKDLNGVKNVLASDNSAYVKKQNAEAYISDMKKIRTKIRGLKHSQRLDALNTNYLIQLDKIISTSENLENKSEVIDKFDDFSKSLNNIGSQLRKGR